MKLNSFLRKYTNYFYENIQIYIGCLIIKLATKSKHIWYKSYSNSKTVMKSSIIYYTLISTIKLSYFSTKNN
jgi:hypothetical protein